MMHLVHRVFSLLLLLLSTELWSSNETFATSRKYNYGAQARSLGALRGSAKSLLSSEGPSSALASAEGWPALPWQQPADWVPPYAQYVNDLPGLISTQRRRGVNWITVFGLTHLREDACEGSILLNTLTSYILLGGGQSYIIMVANDKALQTCLRLKLPCYNATVSLHPKFFSSYNFGTWAKVLMTRLALKALPPDLNLHLSDHDVIYLKRVFPTIERFTSGLEYDVLGQVEDWPRKGGINTGVLFARNTPKVHAMYDKWIQFIGPEIHDQETFMKLMGNMTVVHGAEGDAGYDSSGARGRNASVALVVRHNVPWVDNFWCHWCDSRTTYGNCWQGDDPRHCEIRSRLYIHAICVADKIGYIKGLGLWFLDGKDPRVTNFSAIRAAGLPCAPPKDVADLRVIG